MNLLKTVLTFLETQFDYIFTAVSGVFSTILSELPDDEIDILHGAMKVAAGNLKGGGSAATAFTAALNYVEAEELKELSKIGTCLLQAFCEASASPTAGTASSAPPSPAS